MELIPFGKKKIFCSLLAANVSHVLDLSEVPCRGDPVRDGCNGPLRNAIRKAELIKR